MKTRVLTCLFKEKNNNLNKMLLVLCSPYPPHEVELTGAESLQSPTLTGPPALGASNISSMRVTLSKINILEFMSIAPYRGTITSPNYVPRYTLYYVFSIDCLIFCHMKRYFKSTNRLYYRLLTTGQ